MPAPLRASASRTDALLRTPAQPERPQLTAVALGAMVVVEVVWLALLMVLAARLTGAV